MNELKAAGIVDPSLIQSYLECKKLNAQHGKTYYLATLLLPKAKRPHVHALYGFARYADEIVDDLSSKLSNSEKAEVLRGWSKQALADIARGESEEKIGRALVHTVNTFNIPLSYFEAFLHSMEMDLTVKTYASFQDLMTYVYGSASVIGLQMVPVLGLASGADRADTDKAAQDLGTAFQLANFIRDVGEDLDRGRIYLPLDELQSFGVDKEMLKARVLTPQIREALRFNINRVRTLQKSGDAGIKYLSPESRACMEAASELYCGIVDEVEAIGYDVFNTRAKTSLGRRLKVALPAYYRAIRAR